MKFNTVQHPEWRISFKQALFDGLASDGCLYHPTDTIDLSEFFSEPFFGSFNDAALETATLLFGDEFDSSAIGRIVQNAFTFEPSFQTLEENVILLELFHGPTCAFKDYGAQFMAACMEETLLDDNQNAVILVATSGDTGSAVASAFHRRNKIKVVILYPAGRISPLQEQQLSTWGDNITALEVDGSFDDCQDLVKTVFKNETLKHKFNLTSANSINVGRLLPQSFYYIYAGLMLNGWDKFILCVPSGNFGNLTSGIYAKHWGLNVSHFIAATNANDTVPIYLSGGDYQPRSSLHTLSNAMDVGAPNNWERIAALYNNRSEKIRKDISGYSITDAETMDTIRQVYNQYGIFIDPHTAVGVCAARKYIQSKKPDEKIVVASTAHPAKFAEVIMEAVGKTPDIPERLALYMNKPKRSRRISADFMDLVDALNGI